MEQELIKQIKSLNEPNKDIFHQVFDLVVPYSRNDSSLNREKWINDFGLFDAKLRSYSWNDAAIMLVPETHGHSIFKLENSSATLTPKDRASRPTFCSASHTSLALLICILKVYESSNK